MKGIDFSKQKKSPQQLLQRSITCEVSQIKKLMESNGEKKGGGIVGRDIFEWAIFCRKF